MKMKVPIIGTVLEVDIIKSGDIAIKGAPDDPIRIDVDLGNVSWKLFSIDLVNDTAIIEVKGNPEDLAKVQSIIAGFKSEKKLIKSDDVVSRYIQFVNIKALEGVQNYE